MAPPDDLSIEPAHFSDLDAIVRLWMEMMREHEKFDPRVRLSDTADEAYRQYARYYIDRPDARLLVARNGREVVGFCLAYRARNLPMFRPGAYGFISDMAVTRPWRNRGVGTSLLDAVMQWFRRHGVNHVQLQVYSRNARGVAFWRRCGFEDFVHGMWLNVPQD